MWMLDFHSALFMEWSLETGELGENVCDILLILLNIFPNKFVVRHILPKPICNNCLEFNTNKTKSNRKANKLP